MAKHILMLGATGTAGSATALALRDAGHQVLCYGRTDPGIDGTTFVPGGFDDMGSLHRKAFGTAPIKAVVSCLASRTGAPADAWAVDHDAHQAVLSAARQSDVDQFVLMSAICVQKPRLAFQQAKLAFEQSLVVSGLTYSIVRPTALFKSLCGQIRRLRAGKPFLLFGDGTLTSCKPISDDDLGRFMASCLSDPSLQNRVLPIGGPGGAITPREQGAELFRLLGKPEQYRHVPIGLMTIIETALRAGGKVLPRLADKAEFAAIGRYYATESMLLWDAGTGRYDADATPEFGQETLFDFYARLVADETTAELGDHAVF